jgi:hypothetical protein
METTVNQMSDYATEFFHKLSNYLDTKIYYYGSVQRVDYFPQSSDIDVDIFTDNEQSTITKMQNLLGIERHEFKKFVYKLHKTNKLVTGYKVQYKDIEHNFATEMSIYNEKNKENVLNEHNSKIKLPFYISVILIILKTFYYNLGILPKNVFLNIKKFLMNYLVEGEDVEFIIL